MHVRGLRGLLAVATRIGSDPLDSPEERLRKGLLAIFSLIVVPPGIVWGILYCVFGERIPALFPWGLVVLLALSLGIFSVTRSFRFLRNAELTLILVTPFLLLLSLGGIVPSSGVILWSFLAPVGAIAFDRTRRAWIWFAAFLVLLVVGIPLAPVIRSSSVALPPELLRTFAVLNIGAVAFISFTLLATSPGSESRRSSGWRTCFSTSSRTRLPSDCRKSGRPSPTIST
ncbi:MAG TPA: hypothetical protein VE644_02480, partial [Gaiellaceae bacterium]|nr:hypothetical protein [Gaiellaceae bacterium]